ncbi:hypothetical protein BCO26_0940 [Heyndrickxia coagulans 2-6]|nr:hypothetical protein BCO26_0940 [Heyndrickxia coagulans 2-6]
MLPDRLQFRLGFRHSSIKTFHFIRNILDRPFFKRQIRFYQAICFCDGNPVGCCYTF